LAEQKNPINSVPASLDFPRSLSKLRKRRMEAKVNNAGNDKRWSLLGMTALVTGGTKGIG